MRQDSVIRKLSGMTLAQCKTYNMVGRLKNQKRMVVRRLPHYEWANALDDLATVWNDLKTAQGYLKMYI